jgi:hypothetical protein
MFFRVLSAMLAADAIDRHLRAQQHTPGQQESGQIPEHRTVADRGGTPRAEDRDRDTPRFDPRAPERP